jgi:hypothetical protein
VKVDFIKIALAQSSHPLCQTPPTKHQKTPAPGRRANPNSAGKPTRLITTKRYTISKSPPHPNLIDPSLRWETRKEGQSDAAILSIHRHPSQSHSIASQPSKTNFTNPIPPQQTQQRILRPLPRSSRQEPEVSTTKRRRQINVYRLFRVSPENRPNQLGISNRILGTDDAGHSAYKECKKNWASSSVFSLDWIGSC